MARRLGNISRETIPLLILFVAQQKPSRGGLWHPILMQFYSGPLMQLLSGVDIPQRFDAYKAISLQIREIFAAYTPIIEPLSLDEAYLDVTENLKGIVSATQVATEIRA